MRREEGRRIRGGGGGGGGEEEQVIGGCMLHTFARALGSSMLACPVRFAIL